MKIGEQAVSRLKALVDLFSKEDLPEQYAKVYLKSVGIPSDKWTISNKWLMLFQNTEDARGYQQWQAVKRQVKKGSKAIYILAPTMVKIPMKDSKTGAPIYGEDGKPSVESRLVGFHGLPLFRVEDTEGEPVKYVENEPKTLPPLMKVAEAWGIAVKYRGSVAGEYGSTDATKNITLATNAVDTFFHELAHVADNKEDKLKGGQDPKQEAVAQLTACVLAELYGYDVKNYTYNYVAHYAQVENKSGKKPTPEQVGVFCFQVMSRVEKVINRILEEAVRVGEAPLIEA